MAILTLDETQRQCVAHRGRALIVVAGPGSGKTRTLVAAVRECIDTAQANPRDILVVTFTRLAAAETMRRLGHVRGLTVGTFHGVCYQLVCDAWEDLGFRSKSIELFDRIEQERLIGEVITLARRKPSKTKVLAALNHMGEHGVIPEDADQPTRSVIQAYIQGLKQANAVDYQTAAYLAVERVRTHPPGWTHIFTDEVQDLDRTQWTFFERCKPKRLFAVGDVDQLVYEWRGADVGLMREAVAAWGADVIKLETNYRSGRAIIAAADRLIAHNQNRIPKRMSPARMEDGRIEIIGEEAFPGVVEWALGMEESIAVLGRTHAAVKDAVDVLRARGFDPAVAGRQERLLERRDVREVFAVLTFPDLPLSTSVCERALRALGHSPVAIADLQAGAKAAGLTFWTAAQVLEPRLAEMHADCEGLGLSERLEVVAGFLRSRQALGEAWGEVSGVMSRFVRETNHAHRTPAAFMAWLNARDLQDEVEIEAPLQAMTIHASKGLEFDRVFIVGMHEGVFPSERSAKDPARMEEERRLAFVALTRARDNATFVLGDAPPSRFLQEMGLP